MNIEKLFSLMPLEVVKEEDINKRIEEERELINAGKSFVSRLSINRFLYKKLADFDINERLNLFSELMDADFVYDENGLYFNDMGIDSFVSILQERFKLENIYHLDNFYIENLLSGKDITEEEITIDDEYMSFEEMFAKFVFRTGGMSMGDTPNLMLMLVVKKALIGTYLAEKNIESLLEGKREIYDFSILK